MADLGSDLSSSQNVQSALHPRIAELLDHLAKTRVELRAAVHMVHPDLRERKPAADRWSVAEILEHLDIVERRITGLVAEQAELLRAAGAVDVETSSVLGSMDTARAVDRTRRIVTTRSQPSGSISADAAWDRLESTRAALQTVIRQASGLPLGTVRLPHPALGAMTLYEWVAFVGLHEQRHAKQIVEVSTTLEESQA